MTIRKSIIVLLILSSISTAVSVKEINLDNGIRIVGSASTPDFDLLSIDFPASVDPNDLSAKLTAMIQRQYEIRKKLNTFPNNDPVRQHPPVLPYNCRIAAGNLIITQMYVAIHVYSLAPLKYNIRCSKFLIEGEWWQE